MDIIVFFAGLAIALFVAAFIAKRRFGLLGLALAAGSILSTIWSFDAGLVVSSIGIVPSGPLTTAVTLCIIVLLPAVVLLFHGYTYKNLFARIVGSLLFTVLALAFLIEPLGYALSLQGVGAEAYKWLLANKDIIISIALVLAVVDLFFTKPASPLIEKKSKK